MAFNDIELARYKRTLEAWLESQRPPPHLRPKLDFGYRMNGQSVELFEIRPAYMRPGEKLEHAIAKATWNKRAGLWKLYWQRADLKWHVYAPLPPRCDAGAVSQGCRTKSGRLLLRLKDEGRCMQADRRIASPLPAIPNCAT